MWGVNMYDFRKFNKLKTLYEFLIVVGVFAALILSMASNASLWFLIPLVLSFTIIIISIYQYKHLSFKFRQTYVVKAYNKMNPSFSYMPDKGFTEDDVFNTLVIKKGDQYKSENFLSGTILDHKFQSADVSVSTTSNFGLNGFKGRIYKIEMPSINNNEVYIMPKMYNNLSFDQGLKKIESESMSFNQKFNVYATKSFDAFYVLSSKMLTRIENFSRGDIRFMLSYQKHILTIAIDTKKDYFNFKVFEPIDTSFLIEIKNEFKILECIIKELKK